MLKSVKLTQNENKTFNVFICNADESEWKASKEKVTEFVTHGNLMIRVVDGGMIITACSKYLDISYNKKDRMIIREVM